MSFGDNVAGKDFSNMANMELTTGSNSACNDVFTAPVGQFLSHRQPSACSLT